MKTNETIEMYLSHLEQREHNGYITLFIFCLGLPYQKAINKAKIIAFNN